MSKSKKIIDKFTKLIEEGMLTSKDIADEVKNSLNYKKENVINKLNLVTRDEFEIQKARLDKIQEEFVKLKKKKIKNHSFQLELIKNFNPSVSVLLNLSKDHLDRYKSTTEYGADRCMCYQDIA